MRQLTRATRAYYGLILINFVALMYNASLYLLVTNYVLQRDLSTYLLQKLNVVPGNVHVMYWSTAILYGVLVLLIFYRHKHQENKHSELLLLSELFIIILLFWLTNASYNGLIFLAFADIFFSTKDPGVIKNQFYWGSFAVVAGIILLLSNDKLLAIFVTLPSLDVYIDTLPTNLAVLAGAIRNLLVTLNIVAFTWALLTYVVYMTNKQRNIEEELRMMDRANLELKSYIEVAEENAEIRERKRISREIHDTLGHALTGISAGIDAVLVLVDMDKESAKKQLHNLSEIVRQGIVDVRRSLNKMRPGALEELTLKASLQALIKPYTKIANLTIELDYQWGEVDFEKTTEIVIFRAIEEAITNSIRHGQAQHIWLKLTHDETHYYVDISDNGRGCQNIKYGFGLTQMQERLATIGGKVSYQGDDGFKIKIMFFK
ncbi:MAG TPA: sensor histidine kinase [Lactobacillus sp.]|uniref:sensor histidine kinase n=1 Tax=Ligilactobacillus murinus TaxID=1622 RepID=UPI00096D50E1|nr:sensor histidine kinase [Ligilactobacillus murinus]HAB49651.1 sensor histidine kinase [Lactobacillus sp.]HAP23704.1 sensor histidine kinase [Lactobacillus sp.]